MDDLENECDCRSCPYCGGFEFWACEGEHGDICVKDQEGNCTQKDEVEDGNEE